MQAIVQCLAMTDIGVASALELLNAAAVENVVAQICVQKPSPSFVNMPFYYLGQDNPEDSVECQNYELAMKLSWQLSLMCVDGQNNGHQIKVILVSEACYSIISNDILD